LKSIENLMVIVFDAIKPGLGKVLKWMQTNGGIAKENVQKTIEWCKKNMPELVEFVQGFLALIVNIIQLVPFMIQTIIKAYIDYALENIPVPVKSLIGL
jgi:hypothetical protein